MFSLSLTVVSIFSSKIFTVLSCIFSYFVMTVVVCFAILSVCLTFPRPMMVTHVLFTGGHDHSSVSSSYLTTAFLLKLSSGVNLVWLSDCLFVCLSVCHFDFLFCPFFIHLHCLCSHVFFSRDRLGSTRLFRRWKISNGIWLLRKTVHSAAHWLCFPLMSTKPQFLVQSLSRFFLFFFGIAYGILSVTSIVICNFIYFSFYQPWPVAVNIRPR